MPYAALLTLALSMGVLLAVYLPVLSQSGRIVDSPILANAPFYFFGLVTTVILAVGAGNRMADFARLREVPGWMFLTGVVSALMILGSTFLIPRIGPGPFFVLLVAGQIVTGAVLSHMGWFGAPVDAVGLRKATGLLLVICGAGLVSLR
ncbi:DMT family transporter [Defluviimonas sp. WL0050]|uniref:DMT family transporter n=1 Tax=Albidovulum litorale TaxID=2984134 RepID=A0ABT2ZK36_9RHOB|nr:DMT family transporter [Defluviimonas sp. WL0050]MCV2871475.1 DMT family transporter [Defluviimonas sp. WL0050]